MHYKIRILYSNPFCALFCGPCVHTILAVVGQINQLVFPFTRLLIADVFDEFIYCSACFSNALKWQASYTYIHLAGTIICAFVIIQPSEIVVGGIGLHFVQRVLRLICQ